MTDRLLTPSHAASGCSQRFSTMWGINDKLPPGRCPHRPRPITISPATHHFVFMNEAMCGAPRQPVVRHSVVGEKLTNYRE